ncbi:hypothetical protein [Spiroplasma endosymbiont of Lariophagus distinguendus]|uniref:hypothetical protein n=2 Tax=Spiroplasma TaxID=2132 RepID=UPI00207A4005|nr:hypothetical protein [Spiroplasma endosymbiont of Lariophagus distinguendus]
MSEEDEEKKKKKKKSTKIIVGLIGSAALIGATIAGGMTAIAETEGEKEEEEEEKNKKKSNGSISKQSSISDNKRILAVILKSKTNLQLKTEDKLKMTSPETVKEVIKERLIESNPQSNLIKEKIILGNLKYNNMNIKPTTLTVEMTYDDPLVIGSVILNIIYPK